VYNITQQPKKERKEFRSPANDWVIGGFYMAWLPFNKLMKAEDDPFQNLIRSELTSYGNGKLNTRTKIINKWRETAKCFIPYFPTNSVVLTWENGSVEIYPLKQPINNIGIANSKDGWRVLLKELIMSPTSYLIELKQSVINAYEIRLNKLEKVLSLKNEINSMEQTIMQLCQSFKQLNAKHKGIVAICNNGADSTASDHKIIKRELFKDNEYLLANDDERSNIMKSIIRKRFPSQLIRYNSWNPDQIKMICSNRYSISDINNMLLNTSINALSIQNVKKFIRSVNNCLAQQIIIKQILLLQE
jgi:predicted kinase